MSQLISLLVVLIQRCLTKLLPFFFSASRNKSCSSSCTPSSKANLFASTFASNANLDEQVLYTQSSESPFQLNTSKSSGLDGIPAIVLKSCSPKLAPVLNKLFQLPYNLGISLSSWKLAHVFPIPKKGDKSDLSNYHPIAITSVIFKTMETIIAKQLPAFLEKNNLLSDHQYGFLQARSTGDLLTYAIHTWSSVLESYGMNRLIALDYKFIFFIQSTTPCLF